VHAFSIIIANTGAKHRGKKTPANTCMYSHVHQCVMSIIVITLLAAFFKDAGCCRVNIAKHCFFCWSVVPIFNGL
jgi:hypothetical protein